MIPDPINLTSLTNIPGPLNFPQILPQSSSKGSSSHGQVVIATTPVLDSYPIAGTNSMLDFDAVSQGLEERGRKHLFQPGVVEGALEQAAVLIETSSHAFICHIGCLPHPQYLSPLSKSSPESLLHTQSFTVL